MATVVLVIGVHPSNLMEVSANDAGVVQEGASKLETEWDSYIESMLGQIVREMEFPQLQMDLACLKIPLPYLKILFEWSPEVFRATHAPYFLDLLLPISNSLILGESKPLPGATTLSDGPPKFGINGTDSGFSKSLRSPVIERPLSMSALLTPSGIGPSTLGAASSIDLPEAEDVSFLLGEVPVFGYASFFLGEVPALGDVSFCLGEVTDFGEASFLVGEVPERGDVSFLVGESPKFGNISFFLGEVGDLDDFETLDGRSLTGTVSCSPNLPGLEVDSSMLGNVPILDDSPTSDTSLVLDEWPPSANFCAFCRSFTVSLLGDVFPVEPSLFGFSWNPSNSSSLSPVIPNTLCGSLSVPYSSSFERVAFVEASESTVGGSSDRDNGLPREPPFPPSPPGAPGPPAPPLPPLPPGPPKPW